MRNTFGGKPDTDTQAGGKPDPDGQHAPAMTGGGESEASRASIANVLTGGMKLIGDAERRVGRLPDERRQHVRYDAATA